ncbi:site-specific integrase [Microbacterium sp. CFH 31415]|uniref:site-specific integrase n=1 Tax=Microbacterium sp. CFH 31415 TaxID=2921732 RepID=UPI001F13300F|nr:site-specific integrase [Microbacterium sp. CFH 31415]MCH6230539.1 site-specific integrase [Microbacterium sp. CFH 31415]
MREESKAPDYLHRVTRWGDTSWAADSYDVVAQYIGSLSMPNPPRELARILAARTKTRPDAGALNVMATKKLPATADYPEMDAFVRDAVAVAAPQTAYTASLALPYVARYVVWAVRDSGWPMTVEFLFTVRAINRYTTSANLDLSEGTRGNYRSVLMRISEVLLPDEHPDKLSSLSNRTSAAPYTREEMRGFRAWATSQLTDEKRDRAMLMLVLCAGAGIRANEILRIHPEHVTTDENGILVRVATDTPRDVPLLPEWEEWMVALLGRRPAGEPLWGHIHRKDTSNLTSAFTENSYGASKRPRADRLRATWLTHHLYARGIKDLFRAIGVEKMQHLHRLLEFVELRDDDEYRRLLREEGQA